MKSKRKDLRNYGKNKGLASLRTSTNLKGSNPMTKSLKLGTLMNMRKSVKGSDMTKASPSMHDRRNKTNNLVKAQKNRRMRGLLSFHSEEESMGMSQDLRKKNAMLRSEIIERQKKMGKHRPEPLRSVSMVIGDEDKHIRKNLASNNAKKRISKKLPGSVNKRDFLEKKVESQIGNSKKYSDKNEKSQYKTMTHRTRGGMPTLPKKSQGKSYTSNNKARLMQLRQKTGIMQTMPVQKKKISQVKTPKTRVSGTKNSYLAKKQNKVTQKNRVSHSKKNKTNVRRSMNNIYKRPRASNKRKKQENMTIYQSKKKERPSEKGYVTERVRSEKKDDIDHQILSKDYITNPDERFKNIYEKQNIKGKYSLCYNSKKFQFK